MPRLTGQRVRLSVLLVCLGLAVLGLVKSRSNFFTESSGTSAGIGASRTARTECAIGALPPVVSVHLDQLAELRASLLQIIATVGGQRASGGVMTPRRMWLGSTPQRVRLSRSPDGLWPGGYEIRQWAPGGNYIVVDVLLFARPNQARGYFDQFTNRRCNNATTQSAASRPPHARNLIAYELSSATSYFVFLTRGPYVYRIVDLRPRHVGTRPSGAEQNTGLSTVDGLACALTVADCPRTSTETSSHIRSSR